jgi:rubrerythrin
MLFRPTTLKFLSREDVPKKLNKKKYSKRMRAWFESPSPAANVQPTKVKLVCSACNKKFIKVKASKCPHCGAEWHYGGKKK